MTEREALRLALKALEIGLPLIEDFGSTEQLNAQHKAITAIYEALAETEQEPVGEIVDAIEGAFKCSFTKMLPVGTKLYTTPPQRTWVGLTDNEIEKMGLSNYIKVVRETEAKLKEKNT
jgi:hypothetical protein